MRRRRYRSRSPNRWRRAFFGGVIAACLLGLAEIGLRLTGVQPAYSMWRMAGWQAAPNQVNRRIRGNHEPHDFRVTTNADGLRTTLEKAKGVDAIRVAVMGDSNVYGWGVDNDATFAAAAEAALKAQGHPNMEVLNAGQPGYSTAQIRWLFNETVAAYQPDLTIVFISMHDFNLTLISDLESRQGPRTPARFIRYVLARHSRIYELLRARIYPKAHEIQVIPEHGTAEYRVPRVSDLDRMEMLGAMRASAHTWDGEVTVGLLPFYMDLQGSLGQPTVERIGVGWAREYTAGQDVPLVDLRHCCGGGDADSLVFPFDQGHLNADGNTRVGRALAEAILPIVL